MPVKVRCRQCEKVFAAPDRARGKAVRCPECSEPVRVPSGKNRKTGQPGEAETESEDGSFFSSLDLSQAEDQTARLCPKCARDVSTDDQTCPFCHVNLQTGVVSARMRKRLGRKGPNPALFYKAAWADSWSFMLANQRLAIQTWIVNIFIVLLQTGMVFSAFWIVITFHPSAPTEMEQMLQGNVAAEDKPYRVPFLSELLNKNGFLIMTGLSALLYMIATGWVWTMAVQITRTTLARKTQAKRLSFQFVDSLANGFKMYFWSFIFPLPVMIFVGPVIMLLAGGAAVLSTGAPDAAALAIIPVLIIVGLVSLVIVLAVPSALAHMAQKHTYKAWSLPLMAMAAVRNIAPTLYLGLIGLVAVILPAAVFGGGFAIVQFGLKEQFGPPHLLAWTELVGFKGVVVGATSDLSFPWKGVGGYVGTVVVGTLVASYAIIFWMRAVGLYAYYFQQRLGLVQRTHPGQLAGFWARYIAVLVDTLIIAVVGWLFEPIELWKMNEKGKLLTMLIIGLVVFFVTTFGFTLGLLFGYFALLPVCGFSYFARSEASKEQATLGKEAVGIMVTGPNGERLSFKQSAIRALLKLLLWKASFIAGFTPKKQALHDMAAGTLVVFRGDLDRE